MLLKNMHAGAGEFLGTAFLLSGVVGSGMMGERLAGGNMAVALLANALATGFLLPVLIQLFGPISGAHFNPLVSFAEAGRGRLSWVTALSYLVFQMAGAWVGVIATHFMFEDTLFQASQHLRSGAGQWFSEGLATFGLLFLILRRDRLREGQLPWLVGAYIASAYWFTASTSFANPVVTLARSFTNTFSGIQLSDVSGFVLAQVMGALLAYLLEGWLRASESKKHV